MLERSEQPASSTGDQSPVAAEDVTFHMPRGPNLAGPNGRQLAAESAAAGLEALPHMAEIYPLGGQSVLLYKVYVQLHAAANLAHLACHTCLSLCCLLLVCFTLHAILGSEVQLVPARREDQLSAIAGQAVGRAPGITHLLVSSQLTSCALLPDEHKRHPHVQSPKGCKHVFQGLAIVWV